MSTKVTNLICNGITIQALFQENTLIYPDYLYGNTPFTYDFANGKHRVYNRASPGAFAPTAVERISYMQYVATNITFSGGYMLFDLAGASSAASHVTVTNMIVNGIRSGTFNIDRGGSVSVTGGGLYI